MFRQTHLAISTSISLSLSLHIYIWGLPPFAGQALTVIKAYFLSN
jgi:hypothetical protein